MTCVECGVPLECGARFCQHCGAVVAQAVPLAGSGTAHQAGDRVRPWVRFWARSFDATVFGVAFGLLTAIVVPQNLTDQIDGRLLSMAAVFVWVFIEALLVAAFGTTLGKWLLGTKVRRRDTTPLTYSAALARSVKVWWWGIGIGLPLAQQVTMAFAYRRVKRDHMTSWDAEGGFVVLHEPISLPKAFVVASVLALELVVSIVAA